MELMVMRLAMVEQQPVEIVEDPICCPQCGAPIGVQVTVGSQTWMRMGNLETYATHGRCAVCGTEYHWCVGDVALARLIAKCKGGD